MQIIRYFLLPCDSYHLRKFGYFDVLIFTVALFDSDIWSELYLNFLFFYPTPPREREQWLTAEREWFSICVLPPIG